MKNNKFNYYFLLFLLLLIIFSLVIYFYYINYKETFINIDNNLLYYTVGFDNKYINILELSIKSLRKNNNYQDILIICDEQFVNECKDALKEYNNIFIHPVKNSESAQKASMNKLKLFEYDNIDKYNKILFIDSDIIIDVNINSIFNNMIDKNILYVKNESFSNDDHRNLFWSLKLYTDKEINNFKLNNIFVFNAGQYALFNNREMKQHFDNINDLIKNHKGEYFYEQSFMNHYFNLNNLRNDKLLENYVKLFPDDNIHYKNKLVHFAGNSQKYEAMIKYFNSFISN